MRRPPRLRTAKIWYHVPRSLRVLVLAGTWFTYGVLLSNLNSLDDGGRTAEIIWGACFVGFSVTALIDFRRPERFGSIDELVTYSTALRTGDLPDGVELPVWRRRLRRSRLAVALTPLVVFPYLAFGVMSADMSQTPYRVMLLCMFMLCGSWVFVRVCRQSAHIGQLQSAIRHRQERLSSEPAAPQEKVARVEKHWRSNAETPMAERLITTAVFTSAMAFLVLLLADLDSVVYSDSRGSRLGWAALCAAVAGVVVTGTAFGDPRLRATSATIDAILQYDRAFRTTELPAHFDVAQWRRWMKSQHRSDAVTLIWAFFFLIVGGWSILSHPPGYHWAVAILLGVAAIWQIRRWRFLCGLIARLENVVERHAIRQLFG